MRESKNLLAKQNFVSYYKNTERFQTLNSILRTLLIVSLFLFTFHSNVFADLKEESAEDYRLKGYSAQQEGKLDEALSFYTKAAALSANPAILYNDIGVVYEKLGLLEQAETSYLEALHSDSHYLPTYANLAYLYERQEDYRKAAEYLKKRVAWGDANDPWTKHAKERLSELSERFPDIRAWLERQQIDELNQALVEEAREDFHQQVIKAKDFYERGQKLDKDKKYKEAIMEYNRALSFTPQNPNIIAARNQAILNYTYDQAKVHADSALKMLRLGDTVSAKIEFRKILAIIPNEPIQVSK
ncbi:MAG: hypothetical protein ABIJ41_05320 [Candidatus Omnitrophota bacterium]